MKRFIVLSVLLITTSLIVSAQDTRRRGSGEKSRPINAKKDTTRRQAINPPGISPLVPAYSVAIRHGGLVFVSGMTGVKPGTQTIVDGGVEVQTRQTLENIRTTLEAAGAAMADIGECTVFLVDMADYAAMNRAYVEFFPKDPPARATLSVTALPRSAARVEIKCSAVVQRP